jgi:hypothetical protein
MSWGKCKAGMISRARVYHHDCRKHDFTNQAVAACFFVRVGMNGKCGFCYDTYIVCVSVCVCMCVYVAWTTLHKKLQARSPVRCFILIHSFCDIYTKDGGRKRRKWSAAI